jgi:phosphoserine aminotransferase
MLDWHGSGMCVMEMSHRGKEFMSIAEQAEADLRELLGVPDGYKVLFLQGGASSQFAMVPMNLCAAAARPTISTPAWSKKAIAEAKRFGRQHRRLHREDGSSPACRRRASWPVSPMPPTCTTRRTRPSRASSSAMCRRPAMSPLVADMSSTILSRPIDVSRFGIIYAGAQKNIGPAGLTIVIVREDLIGQPSDGTPAMFDYKTQADADSMYNTPPTYAWYLAGLVFQWLKDAGRAGGHGRDQPAQGRQAL